MYMCVCVSFSRSSRSLNIHFLLELIVISDTQLPLFLSRTESEGDKWRENGISVLDLHYWFRFHPRSVLNEAVKFQHNDPSVIVVSCVSPLVLSWWRGRGKWKMTSRLPIGLALFPPAATIVDRGCRWGLLIIRRAARVHHGCRFKRLSEPSAGGRRRRRGGNSDRLTSVNFPARESETSRVYERTFLAFLFFDKRTEIMEKRKKRRCSQCWRLDFLSLSCTSGVQLMTGA